MPAKLSNGGLSSLDARDRLELSLLFTLFMNEGDLSKVERSIIEIALADPAISKFLELKLSQGVTASPNSSINPQMSGAFTALGIAGSAGIMQRNQIRQELNEMKENLDEMSGGESDPGGFDPNAGRFF